MSEIGQAILRRMFGHPQGLLGRLGGMIMASMNGACGAWAIDLLEPGQGDSVLEVGFGPGMVAQRLSNLPSVAYVAGVDPSREMVEQARARNASAIESGRVDLRIGSVESLPFDDNSFDKALAINSMQVWPDALAGLREIARVMKPGGKLALAFTPYSGQLKDAVPDMLVAAGFTSPKMLEKDGNFCALTFKP